jgi:hypothetical protein
MGKDEQILSIVFSILFLERELRLPDRVVIVVEQ